MSASTEPSRGGGPLSLWWAPLDLPASPRSRLAACLSPEERTRADGYRHPLDRARFVAAHGWQRQLLSRELLCPPDEVRISTGEQGKPEIESSDLKFNSSRSAGIALFVTSWTTEVGVDVEAIRADAEADLRDIARRFFSAGEQAQLAGLPPQQRLAASFQCWTCKEAYGKAIGSGIGFPLQTVDTWAEGSRQATVSEWTVHQIEVAPGFAAAVAGVGLEGWVPTVPRPVSSPDSDPSPAIIEP